MCQSGYFGKDVFYSDKFCFQLGLASVFLLLDYVLMASVRDSNTSAAFEINFL